MKKHFIKKAKDIGLEDHMKVDTDSALELASQWLDNDYVELCPGVFENPKIGTRVRMTNYDLNGHNGRCPEHINFETVYGKRGPKYHVEYED